MERLLSRPLAALALGIAGAVAVLPAAAQTPQCGTVLTQSVQLNADMFCPVAKPALVVGADNVRIDLAGYGIYALGPFNWIINLNAPAITAYERQNVEVVGPGLIKDFLYDVEIVGGRHHLVSGIKGQSWAGISLRGASDTRIQDNDLISGVAIRDNLGPPTYATGPAMRNQIVNNRFGTTNQRAGYVALFGCQVTKNTATDNEIFGFVWMDGGAYGNFVVRNRIASYTGYNASTVLLGEAFHNEVRDNVIDADGETGISIEPQAWPACSAGRPGTNGDNNLIYGNVIRNGTTGLHVGMNPAPQGTLGTGNVILGNTFVDLTLRGQYFGVGTANNDGRKNKYVNVPVEVEDFGTGNLWP